MDDFQRRAEARKARLVITRKRLGEDDAENIVSGEEGLSLLHRLSMTAWAWSGKPLPTLRREELPIRFLRRQRT